MRIEQIASRYRVVRELGRGGMGVVYVVEHLHTGEHLALKLLHGAAASDPGAVARFKREARAAAQIKSEHVVRVTDADVAPELGGAPFLVMELLDGFDLEKAVLKLGRLHADPVVEILSQIARALDKAHAIGIVHRDLKPENIFLHRRDDGSAMAKVLDFGISKFLTRDGSAGLLVTTDGTLMGTPYYMAPEQARAVIDSIGPPTDVWAIGLIALRLLTADLYWTAQTQADLMVQILVAPMSRPSERWPFLGLGFDDWFARSCHRDLTARWGSIGEQVAALDDALRGSATLSGADGGGATMETVLRALREPPSNRPVAHASTEAVHPSGSGGGTVSVMMPGLVATPPLQPSQPFEARHGATTSGAGSLTVTASGKRPSMLPRVLVWAAVVGVAGAGVFAYRFVEGQRAANTAATATAVAPERGKAPDPAVIGGPGTASPGAGAPSAGATPRRDEGPAASARVVENAAPVVDAGAPAEPGAAPRPPGNAGPRRGGPSRGAPPAPGPAPRPAPSAHFDPMAP